MKYRYHPSINIIRRHSQPFPSFYFLVVDKNTELKEIRKLSVQAAIQDNHIPIKVLKKNEEFFAEQIHLQFNEGMSASQLHLHVTPALKEGSRNIKNNYRPLSILPVISKVFEKLMCKKLSNHFDNIFSKFQCDFRKHFGAQHCLLLMIDK